MWEMTSAQKKRARVLHMMMMNIELQGVSLKSAPKTHTQQIFAIELTNCNFDPILEDTEANVKVVAI